MHARGWEESPPCLPEYHRPEMPADDPILRRICFPLSPLLAQNALIRQKLFYSNIPFRENDQIVQIITLE